MEEISCKLTVYFDDPFWAAVCERQYAGQLEAAKVVFGAEPKDYEAYAYFLSNRPVFSPAIELEQKPYKPLNPKRARAAGTAPNRRPHRHKGAAGFAAAIPAKQAGAKICAPQPKGRGKGAAVCHPERKKRKKNTEAISLCVFLCARLDSEYTGCAVCSMRASKAWSGQASPAVPSIWHPDTRDPLYRAIFASRGKIKTSSW